MAIISAMVVSSPILVCNSAFNKIRLIAIAINRMNVSPPLFGYLGAL
jgi:hypothetical protein